MKIKLILFAVMLLSFAAFAQEPPVPTDEPASTGIGETFKPILDLLGGKGTWITTVISWFAAIGLVLAPFGVWIRNKLADMLNEAAKSSDKDDDTYLRAIFSNKAYRLIAFTLNFANIRMPNLTELERAIALQEEAVKKATE